MSRAIRVLASSGVAAVAVSFAPAAHATPVGPVCREVASHGTNVVSVCVRADPHESGTTVEPTVSVDCTVGSERICAMVTGETPGKTGFVRGAAYPLPTVDPATGTVHVYTGTIGTLWVNGTAIPLGTRDFCVGDPTAC